MSEGDEKSGEEVAKKKVQPVKKGSRLYLSALPEYEDKLLSALAFFLGRGNNTQALAALAMYLRQSQERILAQVEYYGAQVGKNKWQMLDEIYFNREAVEQLLGKRTGGIHEGEADVFSDDE